MQKTKKKKQHNPKNKSTLAAKLPWNPIIHPNTWLLEFISKHFAFNYL